jgi:RsiW-degrading membrane proteinase PrsW (M82 family)
MKQRNRKLIGIILILVSIVIWLAVATGIYLALPPDLPIWILMPYFLVAGMGWLWPAMWIIRWMSKPDA